MAQIDKSSLTAGNGQRLTKGLFVEYSYEGKESKPVYTLAREDKEVDGVVYPSLYRLYMECDDITEAVFVSRYMLDARQWEMVSSGSLFKEEIQNWRNDLKLKKLALCLQNSRGHATHTHHGVMLFLFLFKLFFHEQFPEHSDSLKFGATILRCINSTPE